MSLQIHNSISPNLARLIVKVKDRRPVLEAMGQQLVTITKKAFNDASLRASAWPGRASDARHIGYNAKGQRINKNTGKVEGKPLLKKTGALWQSIRITAVAPESVTVGSDRPYAAIHQFGGPIHMPDRKQRLLFDSKKRFMSLKRAGRQKKGAIRFMHVEVGAHTIDMPARPFFPFLNGRMTALAAKKVEAVAVAKARRLIGN